MAEEFSLYWKHYVLQSILATLSVFIVLYFLSLQEAVIIASIGATAFIVFTMPNNITAQSRNVIGGHLIGLFYGFLFSLIPHSALIFSILIYSLAVGASIFTMVVTDTEHSSWHRFGSRDHRHKIRCVNHRRDEHNNSFIDSPFF